MREGWSNIKTYNIYHNKVGGVTNSCFKVDVHGISGLKLLMKPLQHVSAMLVAVLDPNVEICKRKQRPPLPEESNKFYGILD